MTKNKFRLIYDQLATEIQKGMIQPGELLPSENELADTYQASRETIRKALKLLSEHGYIQKVQGKGSIVLDISKIDFPISGLVSFKELADKMGKRAKTTVVTFSRDRVNDFLREHLQAVDGEEVWSVARVREIDGEKIILDKDFLRVDLVPVLTKKDCEESIYAHIEEVLGLVVSFAKKEITVEEPTEEDMELLDLEGYSNVVVVKSHVYLDDAKLFQYTESRHRPDKFRFVDFARRAK
ncbi:trehalose operon repressor [Alkalihalophilus marmarensis]|uniref:trehalose operon repressor n=1 Tax=Alkalihalophilus marmarensis TaxID=521377 RepID=UPI002DBA22A3|nr:trehalose operon repressor [Alkalihalophilus marmarensis]MEC2072331.1 trehalose operon repressor [Alkalihalophilus marmarensis]